MKKSLISTTALTLTLLSVGVAFAKTTLGTVKSPSGVELTKVRLSGEVENTSVNGKNQIQIKEADGKTYLVNLGKRGYVDTAVKVGDQITVEGIEHTAGTVSAWSLTKADGSQVTIRTALGKPAWSGNGQGSQNKSQRHNGSAFVDANKDGVCDNRVK